MSFDFRQQYKNYSNVELLKIVRQPEEYQSEAVAAATQMLNEREVTPAETKVVDQYMQEMEDSVKARKEKVEAIKHKAADFLEPVLQPGEKVEPAKWVNILLLVIALQYVWLLWEIVRRLIRFMQCSYCRLDFSFAGDLFTVVYVPVIFFLLLKRNRWGWILLFADNLFSLMARLSQVYLFFAYQNIHQADAISFFFPFFIETAFILFLWREPIVSHFGVTDAVKKKTALIVAAGTVLLILIGYLILHLL